MVCLPDCLFITIITITLIDDHHVLFIDCQEVLDFTAVFFKAYSAVIDKGVNALTVCPSTISVLQALWQVEVIQCYNRFNAVFMAFVNDIVVVLYTDRVDFAITCRDNT